MSGQIQSPQTLVAIIVAARKAGDRELERQAKRVLESEFRVRLTFAAAPQIQEVAACR